MQHGAPHAGLLTLQTTGQVKLAFSDTVQLGGPPATDQQPEQQQAEDDQEEEEEEFDRQQELPDQLSDRVIAELQQLASEQATTIQSICRQSPICVAATWSCARAKMSE